MTRLAFALLLAASTTAGAQPLGTALQLSGPGCRFPDVAWSATSDRFLVVWADYSVSPARVCGRLVTSDGTPQLAFPCYSDAIATALYPAVAWSDDFTDEFLVTWDDSGRPLAGGEGIWGQRVKASDGSPIGSNFKISGGADAIRSGVTGLEGWGYAVTYASQLESFVRFVSLTGELGPEHNVSEDAIFSGYPAITSIGARVLATWDRDDGAIGARLLDASSRTVLGPPFAVSRTPGRDRSSSAADRSLGVFWVNFNDQSQVGAGHSYDQQAQRVSLDGGLIGAPIEVAATSAFEGETLVGTDTAFDTWAGRAISAFQFEEGTSTGLAVQELDESGALDGTSGLISMGADGVMAIAIDERAHHAVVVWERGSPHTISMRLVRLRDTRPPGAPHLRRFDELPDGGVSLFVGLPEALDVKSVTLRSEDGGAVGTASSSTYFTLPRTSQRVCAVASDGTSDSAPACVELMFSSEPLPDGGVTTSDGGTGGRLMGSGSCACDSSGGLAACLALWLLRRRRPRRR